MRLVSVDAKTRAVESADGKRIALLRRMEGARWELRLVGGGVSYDATGIESEPKAIFALCKALEGNAARVTLADIFR